MRTYPTLNRGNGGVIASCYDWKVCLRGWCRISSTHRLFQHSCGMRGAARKLLVPVSSEDAHRFLCMFGCQDVALAHAWRNLEHALAEAFLQTLVPRFVQWLVQVFAQALAQALVNALAHSCSCRRRRRSCKRSLRRSRTGVRVDCASARAGAR